MSQYPPPPPSYGAYDQPPPAGFGYPPNQGPYYPQPGYPQPGYPQQPTTCPPAPGGYYPGQPATQTIEGDQPDYPPKEKEILNQETNCYQVETEKHESRPVPPLYKKRNCKPTIHTYGSDRYKSSATKQHDEKQESVTLECENFTRKQLTAEGDSESLRQVSRKRDHSDAKFSSVEHKLDAQKSGYNNVEFISEKHNLVAREGGPSDEESVNEKHKLVAREEVYNDIEPTSAKHKLVARKRGYSDVELANEKHKLVVQEDGNSDAESTSETHTLLARKRGYSDVGSANEKHRLLAREGAYSDAESTRENHKLIALEGGYGDVEATTEKHKLVAQERGHCDAEPTILESETEHLQHDENNAKECQPMISEYQVELKLSSNELKKSSTFNSRNSEKFFVAENMDNKSKIPTFQGRKHQRFPKTVLGKNNEMHRLLDSYYRNPMYQPQFRFSNNYQPKKNLSYYQRNITTKLSPYNKNDESCKTDYCKDEYCPGDCGKDDDHSRPECCEETCFNDDCHTNKQEYSSVAVVEPEYRKKLLPKVLISNHQAETSNKSSYRVVTSQPTSFSWNNSYGSDGNEENLCKGDQKVSPAPAEEVIYRNYVPQKVLNNTVPPADSKNNTQRVITAEPVAPNRHSECDCFSSNCCSDNCSENGCCKGNYCSNECCEDNCCKKKCCKQGCCQDSCFSDVYDRCSDCLADACSCFCDCIGNCLAGFCDCCGEACDCDDDDCC